MTTTSQDGPGDSNFGLLSANKAIRLANGGKTLVNQRLSIAIITTPGFTF